MKRISFCLIIALLSVCLMPIAAFCASDYSVDSLDVKAELRTDSSALINETWTVTFNGESEGFVREIVIPEDNFETFSSVSDISVSVDGNGCNLATAADSSDGTYSVTKTDNSYVIHWYQNSENETHSFSVRYILSSAVKIYKDNAYFYCTAVNKGSGLVCRNVSVEVMIPGESLAEDYTIIESGSLAGKKTDGAVLFSADNTADEVKVGLTLPVSAFDTEKLPVISDDYTGMIIVLVIVALLVICMCAYLIYFILHYRQIFRKKCENKCRKNVFNESSYLVQSRILESLSPAKIINIVTQTTVSESDRFIVNLLELIRRGYITVTNDGFCVTQSSDCDDCKRPFDKNDKFIMRFFSSDDWSEIIQNPEKFYETVNEYNKMLGFADFRLIFTSKGRKQIRRCFELKLSAKRHEFVTPEEISDDYFRNKKYSVADLIVSVLNEYDYLQKKDYQKPDTEKFRYNMFMLRSIYEKGKDIFLQKEIERLREKQMKKQTGKAVKYDDYDSQ